LDEWIETTAANHHSPAIFLYFKEISTNNLWKALRLGAKECFTFPINEEDFQNAVGRIAARTEVRLAQAKPTQIISIMGCKGGVGTTFLVANLASLLAQEARGKVLAVDLDLGYGQLNYLLDIHPEHTMVDLVENLERLDNCYKISSTVSKITVMYCQRDPSGRSRGYQWRHVEKIVRYMVKIWDFIPSD
jgi:pilus assembly protein CpaE